MRTFENPANRWAGLGPYYAMFPVAFADDVVEQYTDEGDCVLDPFAGRGTALFSASMRKREAVGVEINPVGWVYAKTKLSPAGERAVVARLRDIALHEHEYSAHARALPTFFHRCFSRRIRRFLFAARSLLDWRHNKVDRTLMALLLVSLHGKREAALSNQMMQTKAMSPKYAVAWWKAKGLEPPDLDPVEFMESRIAWRYKKGRPESQRAFVYLGNSKELLPVISARRVASKRPRARLLLTSPPYFGITNYHYDQWLRLWLLGWPPSALRTGNARQGKFEHPIEYKKLLLSVFSRTISLLKKDATIYVRTDSRLFTLNTTVEVLTKVFPRHHLLRVRQPVAGHTQTQLFGNESQDSREEVDLILRR